MSEVNEVADPRIQELAHRVALEARLAVEKVAASFADPGRYPITDDAVSIEQILLPRFVALPSSLKQAAATRALALMSESDAQRKARYGDLAAVDLTSGIGVDQQAGTLDFPERLKLAADHPVAVFVRRHGQPAIRMVLRQHSSGRLEFRIHRVKCLDETDGFAGTELGEDEIYLGGSTVDATGNARLVEAFLVRDDFEDGGEQIYTPPRQSATFDLSAGTEFPKSYFVTLMLAEVDNGGLPELLENLLSWTKEKVTAALGAAIGAQVGASGGPVGAAIGAAVGAAVGLVFDFVREIWGDDAFRPATLRLDIPSHAARWDGDRSHSPEGSVRFRGHGGEYQVVFDWHIFGQVAIDQPQVTRGIIYAVEPTRLDPRSGRLMGRHLLWYHHEGWSDGSFSWGVNSGAKIGTRWEGFARVFPGGAGVIYAVQENGDLLWYRHEGRSDGSFRWAGHSGAKVARGWERFVHVCPAGEGVLYGVDPTGALQWFRHEGHRDGGDGWAEGSGKVLRNGWSYRHVFSGGDGVIYAIETTELDPRTGRLTGRNLLWFRHDGWRDGSDRWAPNSGSKVGRRWEGFSNVFGGSDGVIYPVQPNGDLLWYRHEGRGDGSFRWAQDSGRKVGNGWSFSQVFCG